MKRFHDPHKSGPERVRKLQQLVGEVCVVEKTLKPFGKVSGPEGQLVDARNERAVSIPVGTRVRVVRNDLWVGVVVRVCDSQPTTSEDANTIYPPLRYHQILHQARQARKQQYEQQRSLLISSVAKRMRRARSRYEQAFLQA